MNHVFNYFVSKACRGSFILFCLRHTFSMAQMAPTDFTTAAASPKTQFRQSRFMPPVYSGGPRFIASFPRASCFPETGRTGSVCTMTAFPAHAVWRYNIVQGIHESWLQSRTSHSKAVWADPITVEGAVKEIIYCTEQRNSSRLPTLRGGTADDTIFFEGWNFTVDGDPSETPSHCALLFDRDNFWSLS